MCEKTAENLPNLVSDNADNFLISRLVKSSHNAHESKPLTDSTIRDIFNRDVAPTFSNMEEGRYLQHSLRSGGASAAINSGVSERLVGKHGRWKSRMSRERYLKDRLQGADYKFQPV